MNGVPDSPINRYHQVDGAEIVNNTLVNVEHIQLAAGSDAERSAVPINSKFENNLIYTESGRDTFTLYESIFECLKDDESFYARANPLRHPLILLWSHGRLFYQQIERRQPD